MKHQAHDIERFQLWVAVAEIASAVLLVALACSVAYLVGISV